MKCFRNIKYLFFCVILSILFLPNMVNAADIHGLSLRAIKCPMDNYADISPVDDQYWACFDDYLAVL